MTDSTIWVSVLLVVLPVACLKVRMVPGTSCPAWSGPAPVGRSRNVRAPDVVLASRIVAPAASPGVSASVKRTIAPVTLAITRRSVPLENDTSSPGLKRLATWSAVRAFVPATPVSVTSIAPTAAIIPEGQYTATLVRYGLSLTVAVSASAPGWRARRFTTGRSGIAGVAPAAGLPVRSLSVMRW
jgi:hypothetical protein